MNSYGSYPLFLPISTCTVRQGAYFEQMLLLPCVLGEFRSKRPGDGGTFFGMAGWQMIELRVAEMKY